MTMLRLEVTASSGEVGLWGSPRERLPGPRRGKLGEQGIVGGRWEYGRGSCSPSGSVEGWQTLSAPALPLRLPWVLLRLQLAGGLQCAQTGSSVAGEGRPGRTSHLRTLPTAWDWLQRRAAGGASPEPPGELAAFPALSRGASRSPPSCASGCNGVRGQ